MGRDGARGLSLLDILVSLALMAILVWFVRMDWTGRRPEPEHAPPAAAQP